MSPQWTVLILAAALIAGFLLLGGLVIWLRRRSLKAQQPDGPAFELQQLEDLKRMGTVSDEEFRRLRRAALGLPPAEPNAAKSSPPLSQPRQDDDGKDKGNQ
jgi:hypothetical protein